jgi:D-sedoheptulose 7-phosphate isomerase
MLSKPVKNKLMPRYANIREQLEEARQLLEAFMQDEVQLERIAYAADLLTHAFRQQRKVISCGNGGSMSDAMHFAEELSGRFRNDRPALPAMAISDPAFISCAANDYGYEQVFGRWVEAFGQKGDVLLAISTSGNSANVLHAVQVAKARGLTVIGLTGKDGGKLASQCDVEIRIPHQGYADRIQEMHIKVIHILISQVETLLGFA